MCLLKLLLLKLLHFQRSLVFQLSQIKLPYYCLDGVDDHDRHVANKDETDKADHAPTEQLFTFQGQTERKQS